ncbi:Uncharacterised protein [Escherichia coli]|uniref:Uncharacterized protein n=1 Tax=Escherichia coli TaxID=562 RepID=A0A2X3K2J8_ECOLX|nr:Uncharacterised protein [Escherichia coli]
MLQRVGYQSWYVQPLHLASLHQSYRNEPKRPLPGRLFQCTIVHKFAQFF